MPVFVHLAEESAGKSILKNGIIKKRVHDESIGSGVFCMPVIRDFYATHQWVREMRRFGKKNMVGVYFRLPLDEPVWSGRYSDKHALGQAGKAVEAFMNSEDRAGFQVILLRSVRPKEIIRVKALPPLTGWRYFPKAHGRKMCLCPACLARGEYNSRRSVLNRYKELALRLRTSSDAGERSIVADEISDLVWQHKKKIKNWRRILSGLKMDRT
jgi:hypothetical protein